MAGKDTQILHELRTLLGDAIASDALQIYNAKVADLVLFEYDFAVHGGAIGDIEVGPPSPSGTVILDGMLEIVTAPTTDTTATVALTVETAADILAATDTGSLSVGLADVIPVGTAATAVKTTEERKVTVTIASGALTAGKIRGVLRTVLLG
ncbi:MAG: hypothetical protein AAFY20_09350 [Cyanobacteria bacterium J06639_14]